ncbi:hypothetical protein EBR21_04475 [bacterium]|nr:hypothetical protein [bacterium]
MNIFLRKFWCAVLLSGALLCSSHVGRADDALVIRGDQSIPLLSDVPLPVQTTHDIFTLKSRRTPKEEIVLLLGNAELFLTPPSATPFEASDRLNSDSDVELKNTNKDSAGDAQ